MIGQRIGNYSVVRKLGEGGMGAVYEAVHDQLGRHVAVKVLHAEFSRNPQIAMRFFNEARAANIVGHAGIVEIFEFGHLEDGTSFIVMEFLRGESLGARMKRAGGRLGEGEVLRVTRQIASAMAAAHEKNIVHRDLKPDNVMIVPDPEAPGGERTRILDFGVAKVVAEYDGPGAEEFKTRTGMMVGSPAYMAPEQCKGAGTVDALADVYSLGVMVYRMLSGKLPFLASGAGEIMAMHIFATPRPLREVEPSVPEPLAALVGRMMCKDPAGRPTMIEIIAEMERMGAPKATGAIPIPPLLAARTDQPTPDPHDPHPSTIGRAAGQTGAGPGPPARGRMAVWLGAPVLVVLASVGTLAVSHRGQAPAPIQQTQQVQKAEAAQGQAPAALPVVAPAGVKAQAGPPGQQVDQPVEQVDLVVKSQPPGAQVVRSEDGELLGKTPWQSRQDKRAATLAVVLRRPGFADKRVDLDLSAGATVNEKLLPLPKAKGKAGKAGATKKGAPSGAIQGDDDIPILK